MISISVLIRPLTSDDIYEKALDLLEKVKVPARSWRDGGVAKTIVGTLAELGSQGASVVQSIVGGFYLSFAKGDYLTAHAIDVYGVERIEATFATGFVTLTNTGGGVYSVGADELIVRSTSKLSRYRVTEAFVLGSGSVLSPTSITVAVAAIETGAASSVAPAELDDLETPLARVTVTNAASIIGRDAESDDQLVARCLVKKGTWSPFGPRDTYAYSALSAKLVSGVPTSINRVAVSRFSSTGNVTVVCATPNGTPSSDELQAVRDLIEAESRPDSVTVTVSGAVQHATSHVATLWAKGGTDTILRANAEAALATFYASYPIGGIAKTDGGSGYLYLDAISAVLIGSSPEAFDVDFANGTTDTALAANEVATNTIALTVRIR